MTRLAEEDDGIFTAADIRAGAWRDVDAAGHDFAIALRAEIAAPGDQVEQRRLIARYLDLDEFGSKVTRDAR